MTLRRNISILPDVLHQEIDDEIVVLHLASGSYYGLEEAGARFWQLAAEHGEFETIVGILISEYEVEPERLRADLLHLLTELEAADLVTSELETNDPE